MNVRKNRDGTSVVTISFPLSDSDFARLKAISEDREWTVNHVLRKIVPLGLDVYLKQVTLPRLYPDLSDDPSRGAQE